MAFRVSTVNSVIEQIVFIIDDLSHGHFRRFFGGPALLRRHASLARLRWSGFLYRMCVCYSIIFSLGCTCSTTVQRFANCESHSARGHVNAMRENG